MVSDDNAVTDLLPRLPRPAQVLPRRSQPTRGGGGDLNQPGGRGKGGKGAPMCSLGRRWGGELPRVTLLLRPTGISSVPPHVRYRREATAEVASTAAYVLRGHRASRGDEPGAP